MTPALDILAGMLAGTLMGLIASAHAAVLLTYRPPRLLQQRIADGRGTNAVTVVVFGLVVLWVIAGVVAALAADALIANAADNRGCSKLPISGRGYRGSDYSRRIGYVLLEGSLETRGNQFGFSVLHLWFFDTQRGDCAAESVVRAT